MRIISKSLIAISLIFILQCSKESNNSIEQALLLASLPQINSSELPSLDGNSSSSSNHTSVTLGDGPTYSSKYLPQNFSLKIPVIPEKNSNNEVDLSKCYIDQGVESGDLYSNNSRLCGVAFDQVKLELHALFLDLALPDIRAMCKNKIPTCDLEGKEVSITLSEPVMRAIQSLYSYYDYVGLNAYFSYNGYELKNGAKLPYKIQVYEEIDHPIYEYKAIINQRVLSTMGNQVQERPGAANITVYWNKTRKNILFQFHGYAEVFNYKINARRTYDYAVGEKFINYSTELDYWAADSNFAFRLGQSATISNCNENEDCIQHKGIAGYYIGNDIGQDGITGDEIICHYLRSSSGIASLTGGMVKNSYPESGRLDEILIYDNQKDLILKAEPISFLGGWKISSTSPNQDQDALDNNFYWKNYTNLYGTVLTENIISQTTISSIMPQNPKSMFWLADGNPDETIFLNGYGLTGVQTSLQFKNSTKEYLIYKALFLPDGNRTYSTSNY
ncbi:MAG: hypothetical protein KDK36_01875 [Leptospiraceae bacterium]|nr:hypothetical protein [Leptospiraceae bacterium]